MNKQVTIMNYTVSLLSLILFFIVISGCGSNTDLAAQISGKWQVPKGADTIDIKLDSEPKSIAVDGHIYKAILENINEGSYLVKVKIETEQGNTEVWSFRQLWNDNGSAFRLAFTHGETTETLIPAS